MAGELADIVAVFPNDRPIQVVAKNDVAVRQGKPGHRRALGVLDFHGNASGGRGGEVERQLLAAKFERLGHQLSATQRRLDRDKSVDPQRVPAKLVAVLLVGVLADIDRNLRRSILDRGFGFDQSPGLIVVAVEPALPALRPGRMNDSGQT